MYPEDASRETQSESDARDTWSEIEQGIRTVFSKISGVKEDRITRHMTIFQLGLDSINAVQVAAILRKDHYPSVTATDILENPTCSKLALKLSVDQQLQDDRDQYDVTAFDQAARALLAPNMPDWKDLEAVLPCTPLQMGMLTEFLNSKGKDYLNFISFRVSEEVAVSDMLTAWTEVVKAHAILRTGFTPLDHPDASYAMLVYSFDDEMIPVAIEDGVDNFNTTAWQLLASNKAYTNLHEPPWTVALVPSSEGTYMHLAIHHAIYDAQSLQIILSNLAQALHKESFSIGTGIGTVVQDIVTGTMRSKVDAKEFWENQASKTVINMFPVMTPLREETRNIHVRSRTCSLPLASLEHAVKNADLTVQTVAQAAWLRVLSSYLGEPSVVFGTVLSGRDSETMQSAVFPCITTLPVIVQNSTLR